MAEVTLQARIMITVAVEDGLTVEQTLARAQEIARNGYMDGNREFDMPAGVEVAWGSEYDWARVCTKDNPDGDGQAFQSSGRGWKQDADFGDAPPLGI
jgi:hypothetical protein